ELQEEVPLGGGRHVEAVDHTVASEVPEQGLDQRRVVVAVVEGTRPREEVDVVAPVLVDEGAPLCGGEHDGPGAAVAPDLRFQEVERLHLEITSFGLLTRNVVPCTAETVMRAGRCGRAARPRAPAGTGRRRTPG